MASQPKLTAVPAYIPTLSDASLAAQVLSDKLAALPGVDDVLITINGASQQIEATLTMQANADPAIPLYILGSNQIAGYRISNVNSKPGNDARNKYRRLITCTVGDAA